MAEYSRNDDNGASAGSSGGPEFEDVSAPRGGSDVVGRGPAPEFEEAAGPAGAGEPGNAEAGPQVGAPAAGTPGKRSRWPARIIGGVIVLAILAILLGMFLPRERSEARREQSAVNNQQFATAPQPQQTLRQQPQPQPSANRQDHVHLPPPSKCKMFTTTPNAMKVPTRISGAAARSPMPFLLSFFLAASPAGSFAVSRPITCSPCLSSSAGNPLSAVPYPSGSKPAPPDSRFSKRGKVRPQPAPEGP